VATHDKTETSHASASTDAPAKAGRVSREDAPDEPRFSRERLLSREGEQIAGYPHTVIAGALHGADADEFTREEIQAKAEAFLKRPVEEA